MGFIDFSLSQALEQGGVSNVYLCAKCSKDGISSPVLGDSTEPHKVKPAEIVGCVVEVMDPSAKAVTVFDVIVPIAKHKEHWAIESPQNVKDGLRSFATNVAGDNNGVVTVGLSRSQLLDGVEVVVDV